MRWTNRKAIFVSFVFTLSVDLKNDSVPFLAQLSSDREKILSEMKSSNSKSFAFFQWVTATVLHGSTCWLFNTQWWRKHNTSVSENECIENKPCWVAHTKHFALPFQLGSTGAWARSTEGYLSPCGVFTTYSTVSGLQQEHTEKNRKEKFERNESSQGGRQRPRHSANGLTEEKKD